MDQFQQNSTEILISKHKCAYHIFTQYLFKDLFGGYTSHLVMALVYFCFKNSCDFFRIYEECFVPTLQSADPDCFPEDVILDKVKDAYMEYPDYFIGMTGLNFAMCDGK